MKIYYQKKKETRYKEQKKYCILHFWRGCKVLIIYKF